MMRTPRPGYGRVNRVYDTQGSIGYGRLEPLTGGQMYHNFYSLDVLFCWDRYDVVPRDRCKMLKIVI